jgi:5'(3')-deoxyribonucleotidase
MTTILVDVDGVCADFKSEALRIIKTYSGYEDFEDNHTWDFLPHDENVMNYLWQNIHADKLLPYPNDIEAIELLQNLGDVLFVTSPAPTPMWMPERTEWLVKRYNISAEDVCNFSKKQYVYGDVIIEDNTNNLSKHMKRWHSIGLLINQSYNQGFVMDIPTFSRRASVLDAAQYLQEILNRAPCIGE